MPATIRTATLGCKVNQYETEYVRQGLLRAGYRDAAANESADLCIVNTCTVTIEGDAKSRQTIRQLAKRNPQTRIIVMGCYATRAPAEAAALPGVAEVVTDKRELPDLLARLGVADVPDGIADFADRQRAYVKVQDGCVLRCSFCIIPQVRPNLVSRPPDAILAEVRRLVEAGFREIILTGIHLGHYGLEWSRGRPKDQWTRLPQLVERIAKLELDQDFRIRLSSIEATEVTRELLAVLAAFPERVCPHLHVSMQSGSESVLRRMRRRWGAQRFLDRCLLIRETLDLPALTTDIIVGFPGETEAEFADTCRMAQNVGFSKIHIFPFSARPGTAAATMPEQVAPQVKAERYRRLAELESELRDQYFTRLVGRQLRVMVESPLADRPGWMVGTACRYAPVELPAAVSARRQFRDVTAAAVKNGRIVAAVSAP
jgi:threonylcarbamoyladenosine tRNA methylthiotransferase MtaB